MNYCSVSCNDSLTLMCVSLTCCLDNYILYQQYSNLNFFVPLKHFESSGMLSNPTPFKFSVAKATLQHQMFVSLKAKPPSRFKSIIPPQTTSPHNITTQHHTQHHLQLTHNITHTITHTTVLLERLFSFSACLIPTQI